ncbi:hypothetical protein [Dryocola sp. LX212]
MVTEQRTINYMGVNIPAPVLPVELHVMPDFTGRVVVHIEKGRAICDRPLLKSEHVNTLDGFLELARMAGYKVEE